MGVKGGASNCQSQSAARCAIFAILHTVKAIEDTVKMLASYTFALIGNAEAYFVVIAFQLKPDDSTCRRIGHGIIEQRLESLFHANHVTYDNRHSSRNVERKDMAGGNVLPALHHLAQKFG